MSTNKKLAASKSKIESLKADLSSILSEIKAIKESNVGVNLLNDLNDARYELEDQISDLEAEISLGDTSGMCKISMELIRLNID